MNDLISRSALKEDIESLHVMVTGLRSGKGKGVLAEYAKHYKESVVKLIDEAPTVEAKPVVHGEWEKTRLTGEYICSNCQSLVYAEYTKNGYKYFNFCPECGCDMRGGENG